MKYTALIPGMYLVHLSVFNPLYTGNPCSCILANREDPDEMPHNALGVVLFKSTALVRY